MAVRRFLARLIAGFRANRAEDELAREAAAHLALLEDGYQRRGMIADDARRDLHYSARLLRRNPIFALTAALSLAIGIGANVTIFTIANALLLRAPAGVTEPHRLVD